jgi:hypothetical protein
MNFNSQCRHMLELHAHASSRHTENGRPRSGGLSARSAPGLPPNLKGAPTVAENRSSQLQDGFRARSPGFK